MGIVITLFTNGTLVTDEVAGRLAKHPPNKLEISLYGATRDTYEAITGVPGSFEKCMTGIERLLSSEIKLALKSTLSRLNIHELEAMRRMAEDWGVHFSFDALLSKRRDGKSSEAPCLRLSASECIDLEAMDPMSVKEWCSVEKRTDDPEGAGDFYCMAGKNAFVIGPSGVMSACVDLPLPAARPLEIGFGEAWRQVQRFVASTPRASKCQTCEIEAYCGRCPAWSYTETGTLTESVQYLCEIARERHRRYAG
jgi:radical SAM protein with 4Fe4S-binding SPASM domain